MKLYMHSQIVDTLENIEKCGQLLLKDNKDLIDTEIGRHCRSLYPGHYYNRTTRWEESGKKIESVDFGSHTEFLITVED